MPPTPDPANPSKPAGWQPPSDRQTRRKARTRQALIDAAKRHLATGGGEEPSIQQLTNAADVGFGSFYNHFTTKAELFDAAIADVVEAYGQLLDRVTADIEDPAEVFAVGVRLTGRVIVGRPQWAQIISRVGMSLMTSEEGLAPRALRDIRIAMEAGRFRVENPWVALIGAGGSILGLLNLGTQRPDLVDDRLCDEVAEQLLRMFGLTPAAARRVVSRPLPAVPEVTDLAGGPA